MKKFFTLIAAVFVATANINAQTVTISKTDGTKILLKSNQIEKIEFGADKDSLSSSASSWVIFFFQQRRTRTNTMVMAPRCRFTILPQARLVAYSRAESGARDISIS